MEDWRNVYPYIKYEVAGTTFLLTSRPDAYTSAAVKEFRDTWNPKVRFQFTDDMPDYEDGITMHWYPWIPGKDLPTELVWAALTLINKYTGSGVIWMHCDSSSMRAPTFFGHWLRTTQTLETIEELIKNGKWTDERRQSSPLEYSTISTDRDPGMKDLIKAWISGGSKAAYAKIMKVPWPWEIEENTSKKLPCELGTEPHDFEPFDAYYKQCKNCGSYE